MIALAISPFAVGYWNAPIGWFLATMALLGAGAAIYKKAGGGIICACVACALLAMFGAKCGTSHRQTAERIERERVLAIQAAAARDAQRHREQVEAAQARLATIRSVLAQPAPELISGAVARLDGADKFNLPKAVCYARWVQARTTDAEPAERRELDRAERSGARAVQLERRRLAVANRSLICRDGSGSNCECTGSRRGCCSGHGGVARCSPLEVRELQCSDLSDEDQAEDHLEATGRLPSASSRWRERLGG